jgi:hypothetical protein
MADALKRDLPNQRLPLMLSRDGLASQFLNISFSPSETVSPVFFIVAFVLQAKRLTYHPWQPCKLFAKRPTRCVAPHHGTNP